MIKPNETKNKGRNWKALGMEKASPVLYWKLSKMQDNKCALCGLASVKRGLALDHDHETGAIRGLLCFNCNKSLGWFEKIFKDQTKLAKVLEYMENDWGTADFERDEIDEWFEDKRPSIAARRMKAQEELSSILLSDPYIDIGEAQKMVAEKFGLSTRTIQRYIYGE